MAIISSKYGISETYLIKVKEWEVQVNEKYAKIKLLAMF
jgi:hypothetical protein